MITCPNCNTLLEADAKFCTNCGTQFAVEEPQIVAEQPQVVAEQPQVVEEQPQVVTEQPQIVAETVFCPNCGTANSVGAGFCENCGAPFTNETVKTKKKAKNKQKKNSSKVKKLIPIIMGAVAIVVVAAILLTTFVFGGKPKSYALYIKDKEMFYTGLSKIEPWQVTTDLFNDDFSKSEIADSSLRIGFYTYLSEDGKILFFVDKITKDSEGPTIYYRYVDKPKKEPVKIDSDISWYEISKSAKIVTYTDADDNLYQHNLTEKEKIASDVYDFHVSEDGKTILYLTHDEDLYIKESGKDKEKIDSDVSSVEYVSEDLKTVYYLSDETLYKKESGKDKEKILSDVSNVLVVYDSGDIYYLQSETTTESLANYVDDDMYATDSTMTMPQAPTYPSYYDYYYYYNYDYDQYEAAVAQYELDYEKYQVALTEWYEKLDRDQIREALKGREITVSSHTLYYFDGKESKVLTESFAGSEHSFYGYDYDYTLSYDTPIMVFGVKSETEVNKIKMSEINDIYELDYLYEDISLLPTEKYVAVEGTMSSFEQDQPREFTISEDGKTVYFMDYVSDEDSHGELYKMTISGTTPNTPELYDSGVYAYSITFLDNGNLTYYKDVEDSTGELYMDKELIDSDVRMYDCTYIEESDSTVYMTDWDSDDGCGTLKVHKNGKSTKIADDVYNYEVALNGEILYLYDYDTERYKGELYVYKNGKSKLIDVDVTTIIRMF